MNDFLAQAWRALGGQPHALSAVRFDASGDGLQSAYRVADLAAASVGCATLAVAQWRKGLVGNLSSEQDDVDEVLVNRRLACAWFGRSFSPQGWDMPSIWDAIAGDYAGADGWIRLHTNAPAHRAAALRALELPQSATRQAVTLAVAGWRVAELEQAVVQAGGCAAQMRSTVQWQAHTQGQAVMVEPLVQFVSHLNVSSSNAQWATPAQGTQARPLQGLKVLDLTRVLAGPIATRFLAGYGAQVLRLDPPEWDEPGVLPDVMVGKRSARINLKATGQPARLLELLAGADVLVHGYRPGALEALGLDASARRSVAPCLVDVSLCAYGWTGPWATRRGFDSLVQMSSGIAATGMAWSGTQAPHPLPVQALDHATGYLMAAAAVRGLSHRLETGQGSQWRLSLARTAHWLSEAGPGQHEDAMVPLQEDDYGAELESSGWGPVRRLKPPAALKGAPMAWNRAAMRLGQDRAQWL